MKRVFFKEDKNGTKYYRLEGATCPRCGGIGRSEAWADTGYICYECGGSGLSDIIEKVYSPEYLAKLETRRAAKSAKAEDAIKAELERAAAFVKEQQEREKAEAERKARSEYIGTTGDKLEIEVKLISRASFYRPSFRGYGDELVTVYNLEDVNGNCLVWKTTSGSLGADEGSTFKIKATIKAHNEYKGTKQTELSRVKILVNS